MDSDISAELDKRGYTVSVQIYTTGNTFVYQCCLKDSSVKVAVKLLKSLSECAYAKAYSECEVQIRFSYHSRVIKVLDSFGLRSQGQQLWSFVIILEWQEKDIRKEILYRKDHNSLWSEVELMQIARDLIETLAELQESGVAHRDIKPHNVFYTSQGFVKIGDFGSSRIEELFTFQASFTQLTVTGTPFYMSPELKLALVTDIAKIQYNPYKSDVYSLGMTLLHCYLMEPPAALLDLSVLEERTNQLLGNMLFARFKQLLESMLRSDPEERADFVELRDKLKGEFEPRCLHLPNEQRHGYSFACHGFFCSVCAPSSTAANAHNGTLITVCCPVCKQEYEHFQANEDSEGRCSAIHPLPVDLTSAELVDVREVELQANPGPSSSKEEGPESGKKPLAWKRCFAAICGPGKRRSAAKESASGL
jgi:serine/threonine protein kinase